MLMTKIIQLISRLRLLIEKLHPVVCVQYQLVSSLEFHRCSSCFSESTSEKQTENLGPTYNASFFLLKKLLFVGLTQV